MKKLWIFVALLAVFGLMSATNSAFAGDEKKADSKGKEKKVGLSQEMLDKLYERSKVVSNVLGNTYGDIGTCKAMLDALDKEANNKKTGERRRAEISKEMNKWGKMLKGLREQKDKYEKIKKLILKYTRTPFKFNDSDVKGVF